LLSPTVDPGRPWVQVVVLTVALCGVIVLVALAGSSDLMPLSVVLVATSRLVVASQGEGPRRTPDGGRPPGGPPEAGRPPVPALAPAP